MTSEEQNLWYSEDELRALLRGPEGEFVERKRGFDKEESRGVLRTLCAFANDYPDQGKPGVIFIGVDDKSGKPLLPSVDEKLLNQLAGLREDPKFSAPLVLKPSRVSGEDGEVAALQVAPSNSPPIKLQQRVYIRTGASTRAATWEEAHQLSEMRLGRNPPFDISSFRRARLDDLNLSFFREEYLPALVDAEILRANNREITAQLAHAKMIVRDEGERSIPTVLGLLILGRRTRDFLPGAYVQFLRINGDQLGSDPVDEEAISGTVAEVARRLREKLRAHNRVRVEYVDVPLERRKWMYPESALLQVAHNAIMHRQYGDTNAPVRVYWFDDRIEISNPGGLHGSVRKRQNEFPNAGSDYRNPNLAEAMKALGIVQQFGSGLELAKQALEKNGNPPMEWERDALDVHVHCTLRSAVMSEKTPILTFFNNKGGVGKTSLVYHTACMMEEMGLRVLVCDLDPQANLTASFLDEEELESLWGDESSGPTTIYRCVRPLVDVGDAASPTLRKISENLSLLPGDLNLSGFERHLSSAQSDVLDEDKARRSLRILSAFWRVAQKGAEQINADVILLDVGPSLGAINHSALIASSFFITPLGADVYSLQGLRNLGPAVQKWRNEWEALRNRHSDNIDFDIPVGKMIPIGYVVNQPGSVRQDRPVMAYEKWTNRIPGDYRSYILDGAEEFPPGKLPEEDERRLAMARHYRSLVPLAQEARKPIFRLTAADGATGSHFTAAQNARADFKTLTLKILERMDVQIPDDD